MKHSIVLDNQEVVFKNHPNFLDSIAGEIYFPNNYGVSIITKSNDRPSNPISVFGYTAQGRWEDETFEIAVMKSYPEEKTFIVLEQLEEEYPWYKINGGVFTNVKIEFVEEIVKFVKNL